MADFRKTRLWTALVVVVSAAAALAVGVGVETAVDHAGHAVFVDGTR